MKGESKMNRRIEQEYDNLVAMYKVMGQILDDIDACDNINIQECKIKALTDTMAEVVKQCYEIRLGDNDCRLLEV